MLGACPNRIEIRAAESPRPAGSFRSGYQKKSSVTEEFPMVNNSAARKSSELFFKDRNRFVPIGDIVVPSRGRTSNHNALSYK
jgi:hypothetical protein